MGPVRVVLADDHTLVLEAFRTLLSPEVDVVATASDGHELIRTVKEHKPDVVVTDISMPVLNGVDACIKLLKVLPDLKIIFLTVSDDPDIVAEVVRAGAKGYLLKSSAASELLQAIKSVAAGSTYITPLVTESMIGSLVQGGKRDLVEKLTVRQREILQLLAEGNTMKEAAKILSLTPRTIAFHKYRIMETLGIENNAQLVRFAVKSGLLES
ncbi:response regulator transcription factor [Elongatibacter sediminis]|uniref:Response regulator transcription factor n=1 Tax=Elongatibacter sediminis TaxID=3119006 RepID=A0AAW9R9N5_9GAMM